MMRRVFKYRFDRRTLYWTIAYLLVVAALGTGLYYLYEGGYLSAWFTSFVVAVVALLSLSIPRKIVVTEDRVEIRCLLDITEIQRSEIASVRRIDNRRMKWVIPVFGGFGFFGYYGHYLDLRHLERLRIYATEWNHFVEIVDIYEERLIVSCREGDELVALLLPSPVSATPEPKDDAPEEPTEV